MRWTRSSRSSSRRTARTSIASVLDKIKTLGFHYATQAGVTISKNDVVIPPDKEADPRRATRSAVAADRGPVRPRPDHRRGAARDHRQHLDGGHRRRRRRDGADPRRAEPDLHDGQLRRPWLVQADPPARRHARPDGESEGRDHRAPDQGQLHGGPVGARVLHLDARRPQGPRRHGAPHGRLGLPDAASRRRLAGRDHPRATTARRRTSSSSRSRRRRRREQEPLRPDPRRGRAQAARGRQARARRCSPRRAT